MLRNTTSRLAPTAIFFAFTVAALALGNPATASAQSISGERALLGVSPSIPAPAALQNTAQDSGTLRSGHPTGEQALLGRSPQGDPATVKSVSKQPVLQKQTRVDGARALLGRVTPYTSGAPSAKADRRDP